MDDGPVGCRVMISCTMSHDDYEDFIEGRMRGEACQEEDEDMHVTCMSRTGHIPDIF